MGSGFRFWHEQLDVYRVAMEFVRYSQEIEGFFVGRADRRLQLFRAADSVPQNISEGCAQGTAAAKKRHSRIALGSVAECDTILESLEARGRPVERGRDLTRRVGAMLFRLIKAI